MSSDTTTCRTLTVRIPMAPPKGLLSNHRRRNHWRAQHRDSMALQEATRYATEAPTRGMIGSYEIDVTVVWGPDSYKTISRLPDLDNLPPAIKPAIDILEYRGVIDNDRHCQRYTIRQELGEEGAIILAIREMEATRSKFTDADEAAAKHLMPGDLGDEAGEG